MARDGVVSSQHRQGYPRPAARRKAQACRGAASGHRLRTGRARAVRRPSARDVQLAPLEATGEAADRPAASACSAGQNGISSMSSPGSNVSSGASSSSARPAPSTQASIASS